MYGPQLKVIVSQRSNSFSEPLEKLELKMNDGTKNVLLVLKVNPEIATSQTFDAAAKWLGEQCDRMSGNACKYHGVVLTDNDDYKLEVIEIDDEITKS